MSKAVVLLALLVSSALLAACGGGGGGTTLSKEEYGQTVAQAGDSLGQAFEELATKASDAAQSDISSGEDLNTMMDTLATVLGDAAAKVNAQADTLEGLDPPEDAQAANDKLVAGLRALAGDVEELQTAVENGDFANVLDLAAKFQEVASSDAGAQIQSAIDELKGKGYDVEGSS
jgi:hypothetical protein